MSLSSLLAEAEAEVGEINPMNVLKEAESEISVVKADLLNAKADLAELQTLTVNAAPAFTALLTLVSPQASGIPTELANYVALLNAAANKVQAKLAAAPKVSAATNQMGDNQDAVHP
jgi:hypothetical protein